MAITPPGPKGVPVVGNTQRFLDDPLSFMTACRDAYGDVSAFRLGTDNAYLLTDPDTIEHVLKNDTVQYRKPAAQSDLHETLGDGLLLNQGDGIWRRQRQRVQPAFGMRQIATPERLETMVEYATEHIDRWDDGETIDIRSESVRITIKIIVDLMFGVEIDDATVDEIRYQLDTIGESQSGASIRQLILPDWLTRTDPQFQRALDGLRDVLADIIDQRRTSMPADAHSSPERPPEDDSHRMDFLSLMLDAQDKEAEVDDTFLRDEAMTILLAGHDTTSLAITYALYLLAQHPEIAARLREEVANLTDESPITAREVRGLDYTDRVLSEAMRLYPPVPIVPREPRADVRLNGYRIPAGSLLVMSQYVVQRDPRWYDEPETFDPDRWHRDQEQTRPNYAYFPFGAGPRICIGKPLAELEAKLILGTVLQRYELDLAMSDPLELEANITLFPTNPVNITLHER